MKQNNKGKQFGESLVQRQQQARSPTLLHDQSKLITKRANSSSYKGKSVISFLSTAYVSPKKSEQNISNIIGERSPKANLTTPFSKKRTLASSTLGLNSDVADRQVLEKKYLTQRNSPSHAIFQSDQKSPQLRGGNSKFTLEFPAPKSSSSKFKKVKSPNEGPQEILCTQDLPVLDTQSDQDCDVLKQIQNYNDKGDLSFKSPFQLDQEFILEKYNSPKGFGKRSAIQNDLHSQLLNVSIDDVINMVALRVNRKEQLLKQQTELKVQLEIQKQEFKKGSKDKGNLDEQLSKVLKIRKEKENSNFQIKEQIKRHRQKIVHYNKVIGNLSGLEKEREQIQDKTNSKLISFKNQLKRDIAVLEQEFEQMQKLELKHKALEHQLFDIQKKTDYASKLENERVSILKDKRMLMNSLVKEQKLTRKVGDRVNDSPIGKQVRQLVNGDH